MKTLKTIGIWKALRFLWFSWYSWLLHVSLPPVRVWLLRLAGAHVGRDCVFFDVRFANLYHYGFSNVSIGNKCFIGDEVTLDARGGFTLEDHVTLSNGCSIVTHINVGFEDHPLQKLYPTKESRVVIKKGAYIGTGAIILPGVTIGRESVVAAGAVVTKNVPAHVMVAGVPAKVKKELVKREGAH